MSRWQVGFDLKVYVETPIAYATNFSCIFTPNFEQKYPHHSRKIKLQPQQVCQFLLHMLHLLRQLLDLVQCKQLLVALVECIPRCAAPSHLSLSDIMKEAVGEEANRLPVTSALSENNFTRPLYPHGPLAQCSVEVNPWARATLEFSSICALLPGRPLSSTQLTDKLLWLIGALKDVRLAFHLAWESNKSVDRYFNWSRTGQESDLWRLLSHQNVDNLKGQRKSKIAMGLIFVWI